MTGLTLSAWLTGLLTVGLTPGSTLVTGAIIKVWQDRHGMEMPSVGKEYISYCTPFALVLGGYSLMIALGYLALNPDTIFAYLVNAAGVAFASQVVYTAYKSAQPAPPRLTEGTTLTALEPPQPFVVGPPDDGNPHPWGPGPPPAGVNQ